MQWEVLGPAPHFPLQLSSPGKEMQQLPARIPDEAEDFKRPETLGLFAGICLDPPLEKLALPGRQAIATGSIPDEAKRRKHKYPSLLSIERGAISGRAGISAQIDCAVRDKAKVC